VAAWIDGSKPFIAQTIAGYFEAMHQLHLADPINGIAPPAPPAEIAVRFKYNQNFDGVYAMVPAQFAFELAMWPAIPMALPSCASANTARWIIFW